jgi:hypothetical protein
MKSYIISIVFLFIASWAMTQNDSYSSKRALVQDKLIESIILHHSSAIDKNYLTNKPFVNVKYQKDVQAFPDFKFKLNSIETLYDEAGTGQFIDLLKYTFEYEDELFVSSTFYFFDDETMSLEKFIKSDFKYNDANQLVEIIYHEPDEVTGNWVKAWKEEFTYSPHGVQKFTVFQFDPVVGNWVPVELTQYVYNNATGKVIICTEQIWDDATNGWVNTRKYETTYFANENVRQEKAYFWHDILINWELDWFYEYSYYPNSLLKEQLYVDVTGNNWFSEWKSTYEYNSEGDLQYEYYLEWNNQLADFEFVSKEEYLYGENESLDGILTYEYNTMNRDWIFEYKAQFLYDDRYTENDLLLPDYLINEEFDRALQFRYMLTDIHEFEWDDVTGNWLSIFKTKLSYADIPTRVLNVDDTQFIIYPNPFDYSITVDANVELRNTLISIYDSTGKLVVSKSIKGKTTIDLNELPSGVYSCIVHNNRISTTQQLVKI